MNALIKIVGICVVTVFVLCLNVKGKPLFEPVYKILSHISIPVQNATRSLFASALQSGQEYSRKLFHNSVPKVRDAVKSRASAPSRTAGGEPKEEILVEEKEELDDLIKSHH